VPHRQEVVPQLVGPDDGVARREPHHREHYPCSE
jgi:hypothetical protein